MLDNAFTDIVRFQKSVSYMINNIKTLGTYYIPLLYYLKSSGQELILDLQEVAFSLFTEEWLIDDLESVVILNVLPSSISMT